MLPQNFAQTYNISLESCFPSHFRLVCGAKRFAQSVIPHENLLSGMTFFGPVKYAIDVSVSYNIVGSPFVHLTSFLAALSLIILSFSNSPKAVREKELNSS